MPSDARAGRRRVCWAAAGLGLALCAGSPAAGEVIERILAVVDGRPVLLTEVELLERVRGLGRDAALEALIDERLMFREAARFPHAGLTAEDEEQAVRRLAEPLPPDFASAATADLRRLVRRQAVILGYVEFRLRPLARLSEEQLEAAAAAGEGGEALRERLERAALDQRIEAWVKELRTAAQIRYNRAGGGGS